MKRYRQLEETLESQLKFDELHSADMHPRVPYNRGIALCRKSTDRLLHSPYGHGIRCLSGSNPGGVDLILSDSRHRQPARRHHSGGAAKSRETLSLAPSATDGKPDASMVTSFQVVCAVL